MVKVDIISGFLGSGKTTLIKKLLEGALSREKLVVIENEFGQIGIDGSILKKSNVEIKEINSGCICCTLVGDFANAIDEIVTKYKPDRIIIEPSGVGKLSDVIKACIASKVKDLITINILIAVVDALKYQMYKTNFGEFFENQIVNAKTIILSRTQKADEKTITSVVNSIRKLNPNGNIITTPWENLNSELIVSVAEQNASISLEKQILDTKKVVLKKHHKDCKCGCNGMKEHSQKHDHGIGIKHDVFGIDKHHEDCACGCNGNHDHSHIHSADQVFDVWGAETPRLFNKNEIKSLLAALGNKKSYGTILRGKGILPIGSDKWIQFDYVQGEHGIIDTTPDYTGRLCIIGTDLNKSELSKLFNI